MTAKTDEKFILYSFRRCPYAMRARMALHVSGQTLEHREILLKNKPKEMLEISPKGTVPVLQIAHEDKVLEESLDIMLWALSQNDPEDWLQAHNASQGEIVAFVNAFDRDFKGHLDRYKYPTRYDEVDPMEHRKLAINYLQSFEEKLAGKGQLFGSKRSLADIATFPFIRQFANVDRDWFSSLSMPNLQAWLEGHVNSDLFNQIMKKHPLWQPSVAA